MSHYDVFGLGHALVDTEVEVDDAFLETVNIDKGVMSLVEAERQQELLGALQGKKTTRSCGGSAANSVIGLAQFGGKAFHACRVADDENGLFYAQEMKNNGVDNRLDDLKAGVTGTCLVMVTPDAERTMCTALGESALFSPEDLVIDAIKEATYTYIEGYLVTAESGKAAMIQAAKVAHEANRKVALTFSDPGMVTYFREGMEEVMQEGIDLLFCNESEALTYAQCDTMDLAEQKLRDQVGIACITLGAKGALILKGDQRIPIKGFPAKAVDTNGAGDMFAGAFLYAITQGYSLEKAGKLACYASSVLVSQFGARLKPGQAKTILSEITL
ncbi:adenosine kinase [Magnetococcales bacterium HHB-1]